MSKRKGNFIIILSFCMMIIYFIWRIVFSFPYKFGTAAIILGTVFLLCEIVSAVEAFVNLLSSMNPVVPEKPEIPDDWYPEVDVFISTHNESEDVLYKTVNGCKNMKYPDKSKVHIWICDDGYRQEMKELADRMGVGWQGLENNTLAKAGNINNALSKTSAPLVVTFDADMIPTRHFLMETVPYFFLPRMKKNEDGTWVERSEDEIDPNYKIGFIQTPQNFYNPDLFQYNLYSEDKVPNEQDYFFREINVSRNKSNSPIYAGSNTVISRQALEEVGGIATGTITEDFETGIHIQGRGYACYAISKVVAHGLAPDSVDSLIKQRERWGRGCIYSLRRLHVLTNKEMSFSSKISYYACKIYWWTFFRRFIFVICPIIFSVFSVPVMNCKPWQLFVFWLPAYVLFSKAQRIASGEIRTNIWSNVIDTVLFPYLILPIFMEAIGIEQHTFNVTRKDRAVNEKTNARMAVPHAILLAFSLISLILSLGDLFRYRAVGSLVIIYWLLVNSYALTMAIFFMIGRKNLRMAERYDADLPVKIIFNGNTYYGQSIDISDNGLSVKMDRSIFLPKEDVRIHIKTHHYNSHFNAREIYVTDFIDNETGEKVYKYSFMITDISEEDKSQYFQIIYDREPSLPSITDHNDSIFDNLSNNINRRIDGVSQQKRRLYRIDVNETYPTKDGGSIFVYDYSYRYTVLEWSPQTDKDTVDIVFDDVIVTCDFVRSFDDNRALYKIRGGEELCFNEAFAKTIRHWEDANEKE
ncbi:MAG: glycosyltransferase [Lachnospiraceae bacterium]|nr:glycosyltransferase [Lachnospiraceae bacterium]